MNNAKFVIVTDSTGEMPLEYYKEHGVERVCLGFVMDNVNYEGEDGLPIDHEEFYKKLADGGKPTTYQVTAEQAKAHLEKLYLEGYQKPLQEKYPNAKIGFFPADHSHFFDLEPLKFY